MKISAHFVTLLSSLSVVAGGCRPAIDTERDPVDTESFGATVITLSCKRVAFLEDLGDGDGKVDVTGQQWTDICRNDLAPPEDAWPVFKALLAKREDLVQAVNTIFPEEFLPVLQAYVTSNEFLASYDDGTTIAAVDALVGLFDLLAS